MTSPENILNHNNELILQKSNFVRKYLFEKFLLTKEGHPGSVFSMVDLACCLYYGGYVKMSSDNKKLLDKVIVSKGHATATLYPILQDLGIINKEDWDNWGHSSSCLKIFGNTSIPGIDATSGSLGHGLGIAAGYAKSFKDKDNNNNIYVFLSEGELYEGSCWESLLFISSNNLNNIKLIIDRNSLIILGTTEDCVKLDPIDKKLEAFGFDVLNCDGHDTKQILDCYNQMNNSAKPSCLIAKTIKGKGVSFMENQPKWHYWNPLDEKQIETARQELS